MKKTAIKAGLLALIFFAAGFVLGRSGQAETPVPGSAADPLVSQSYVQARVEEKTRDLEQKVKELQNKASTLEAQVKVLESNVK